jgi:hypothetical protein
LECFQIAKPSRPGSCSTIAAGGPAASSGGSRPRQRQSLRAQFDAASLNVRVSALT